MKRFLPYFKYFKPVKWQLLGSVLSGLVYAAATGAGLPLAAKVVFPLIFKDDQVNLGEGEPENSFFVEVFSLFGLKLDSSKKFNDRYKIKSVSK